MQELEYLRTIRPTIIQRGIETLTRGYGFREHLRTQLEQFYDRIEQVVETGSTAWLDPLLLTWANSLTQTSLGDDTPQLAGLVDELMRLTLQVAREMLSDSQVVALLALLLPSFSYAFGKSAQFETQARVRYVSDQLNQVQQALERLDRTKSDFIAVAAHELKTPLTLIEGYAAMLREYCERNNLPGNAIVLMEGIQNGATRLHTIIDDMIDVSLIDTSLMELNFQPVWLNRLFDMLKTEMIDILAERKQTLEIMPFTGSDGMMFADPERLLQVFRNVLNNAVKFTPDYGKLTIDGRKLPGFIEVTIQDTGIGIAAEDLPIIFEKFSRLGNISLHSTGKTKFKGGGPGLGLRIAKGIVESHGGVIWVESPGYDEQNCPGSTFHILLPLREHPTDEKMAKIFAPIVESASDGFVHSREDELT